MSEPLPESPPSDIVWNITRYIIVAAVTIGLFWYYFFSTPVNYESQEHTGKTMGTDYVVKVSRFPENVEWSEMTTIIQSRLNALEEMMSSHRHGSEVSRFNASTDTNDWFRVSSEVARVVDEAQKIAKLTGGAFDITIAPLVTHWGFGVHAGHRQNRSFEELRSSALQIKEYTGYEKLEVRLDPPALKKAIPELEIDLSGIAKGFAVDCIAELLEYRNITDYLIEVGGEVRAQGKRGNDLDKHWLVGIEKPTKDFTGLQQSFPLHDQSLATSGNYHQSAMIGTQRISHIIDPRSGLPTEWNEGVPSLASVAVLASSGTQADAWATAMFVLGEEQGLEFARHREMAVLFLLLNGDEVSEVSSPHWP